MNEYFNLSYAFENIVRKFPDNTALKYNDTEVTYRALDKRACELVTFLQEHGVKQGDIVAIGSSKKVDDYALMLACLKSGVIYTHFDIESPIQRSSKMLLSCNVKYVASAEFCQDTLDVAQAISANYLRLSDTKSANCARKFNDLSKDIDGHSVAYIMFTSGSTGLPKGVAISHQNLLNFIAWTSKRFAITDQDVFAHLSPLYFDNSVFDFYSAMFNGACLSPVSRKLLASPKPLVDLVTEMKCTIWFSVPTLLIYLMTMRVLSRNVLTSIKTFIFGGEGFPKPELKKLFETYSEQAELVNVYGPTECTCICSSYSITIDDFEDMSTLAPLGQINENYSYLILDEGKAASKGELCLLGPLVGLGYYNRLDNREGAYSSGSDYGHFNKPMYRTGDLVHEHEGTLHFVGRADNQIKHLGYRIELEEIENSINEVNGIGQCVVVYKRVNDRYGKIVAFVKRENQDLDSSGLLSEVKEKLPSYMLPNDIRFVEDFPVNPNGKVDRKLLTSSL